MNTHEDLYLSLPEAPAGLFDTIEMIRELRAQADLEESQIDYDPVDYQRRRVNAIRAHAESLESVMETRLGWRRAGD
jgi:hypothetical protein